MRKSFKLNILGLTILISACQAYYGDGTVGGSYSYMETPISVEDEVISKNYIGAKYNKDIAYYEKEKNESGEISFHHSVSKPKVSYAFGGGIFMGNYKVANLQGELIELNGNYNYYGGAIRGKLAYNWSINPHFHWRIIGLQGVWQIERGPFYDFKKREDLKLLSESISLDITNFSFYPYTELAVKLNDTFVLTSNLGLGYRLNNYSLSRFFGLNISYKEKVTLWSVVQNVDGGVEREFLDLFNSLNKGDNSNMQLGLSISF